jgi:hypothetical protein
MSEALRRPVGNSLKWALVVPVLFTFAGWVAQYPYGLIVVGVIIGLGTWAVAAFLAGSAWERPGAAIMVSICGFALMLFAGPGLYTIYMKILGEPAPAVVTKVEDRESRRRADWFCTVVETTGERSVHHISQQENCFGQVKQLQRVMLRKDPLGLLDPRLPDRPGRNDTRIPLLTSAGLFLATGASMLYAGLRRRQKRPR